MDETATKHKTKLQEFKKFSLEIVFIYLHSIIFALVCKNRRRKVIKGTRSLLVTEHCIRSLI